MDGICDNSLFGEQFENECTYFWQYDNFINRVEEESCSGFPFPNPIPNKYLKPVDTPKPKGKDLTDTNKGKSTNFIETKQLPSDINLEPHNSKKNIKFTTEIQNEIKPKRGRIKNKDKNTYKGKHNKFSDDNIKIKIKTFFSNNIVDFINYKYLCEYPNKNEKLVYRIKRKINENIYGQESKNWFNMKIKDYLSQERTKKFKTEEDKFINKANIEEFYKEENNSKLIEYFEMRIRDFYKIYIFGEKENEKNFKGFKTLEDDKKRLKEMEDDLDENNKKSYIEKFEDIAINLEANFHSKKYRKKYS